MTKQELNDYLKSIGGLKSAYNTTILDAGTFEIQEGWYSIIKSTIEELLAVGWDKEVSQVKEKFGGLRFYIPEYPEGGFEIIRKYEEQSKTICEVCGEHGETRRENWWRTLCDNHIAEK